MNGPAAGDGANAAETAQILLNTIRRPVIMVDRQGFVRFANADAEDFFRASAAILARDTLSKLIPFGSPLLALIDQVRERRVPVNEYRVDISSPRLGIEKVVDLYVAPVPEFPGCVVVMLQERSMADKIDRQMTHRGAARSVTGLAAMLAHEIKNPLSGIRGAAQLLELSASDEDRALTRLITDETDRIVSLVDRMEIFSDERPIERFPVNIHVVLDHVKAIAKNGFARNIDIVEDYDPSLPAVHANRDQLIQVFLNLVKNAPRPWQATRAARSRCRRRSGRACASRFPARRTGFRYRSNSACATTVPASPRTSCRSSSTPSSPPSSTAPASGWRWWPRSLASTAASSNATQPPPGAPFPHPDARLEGRAIDRRRMEGRGMSVSGTVFVADDDAAIRTVLNQALSRAGHNVRVTSNAATLWRWIAAGEGDLVVTDVVMPDANAFDMLPRIRKARPELPVVVMSAQNTFMTAIRASEAGAYEYLPKPFDLTELLAVVARALAEPRRPKLGERAEEQMEAMPLIGRSASMQDIYRMLARMMQTDLTVMISGESGTGKELVARALHEYGRRRGGPFVAINMAAIPRDLIESELFGHEKGAFTGAQNRSIGRFEQAEGGTLFLDEIGDMPMEAQTRLLRVLQQGEYTTVGGRTPIRTDVRIVAATNKDLRTAIDQGLFREDLFYRLNVVPLRLPPLRERSEDIPDLVRHFFKAGLKEGLQAKHISAAGIEAMKAYAWPGNVRELENLVRRLAALYPQDEITEEIIRQELRSSDKPASPANPGFGGGDMSIAQAVETHLQGYFRSFGEALPPAGLYQRIVEEVERPLILAAITATRGNQIKAADLLGLNRNTLRKKIRELGLSIYKAPK